MFGIGGNTHGQIQVSTTTINEIGERVHNWNTVQTLKGWLDFMSGEARRTNFNAKIEESTHVFVCDYVELDSSIGENSRMIVNGMRFDIVLIDNPMGLKRGSQLEFFLKYTGGQ